MGAIDRTADDTVVINNPDGSNLEPVLTAGAIQAVIVAIITLLVTLGIPVSNDTKLAILGLVGPIYAILAPLIASWAARKRVTPVRR